MSRTVRIAFIAILGLALTIVAGLDLRLALASRDLADQTAAVALDQHERHPNGIGVVIYSNLDQHERRAASVQVGSTTIGTLPAALDEHERRARAASR
jgi:hypothetical protein